MLPSAHVLHWSGGAGHSESSAHSGHVTELGRQTPRAHSICGHTLEPSGQDRQATSISGQSLADAHSFGHSGRAVVHIPSASQNIAGSHGRSPEGQMAHGEPQAFNAHEPGVAPGTPPLLVPPLETPPVEAPPVPVSPPLPATGSRSPSASVDCPPHALAQASTVPSAKICLVTQAVYCNRVFRAATLMQTALPGCGERLARAGLRFRLE